MTAPTQAYLPATLETLEHTSEPWRKMLVGESIAMRQVAEVIRLVAGRRATVLIMGETGTGKEVVARAIHQASDRAKFPMVSVNCSALPENLIEAELFGHTKGAFTGASGQRTGLFEQANRGTIFLDEIGDMPLAIQAKLLRVLQEREFQRLGSSETVRVDVRVIAASNIDLAEAVRQKKFRQDLFYRLNVVPVQLPSLSERLSDIPLLVEHFAAKICRHEDLPLKHVPESVTRQLAAQSWPGNVRQLEHAVEMAIALSGNRETLSAADFLLTPSFASAANAPGEMTLVSHRAAPHTVEVTQDGLNFDEVVNGFERSIIKQALDQTCGNKARAADMLQMKRTTLLAKLKTLNLIEYLSPAAGLNAAAAAA